MSVRYTWRVLGTPKAQPRPRAYRKGKRAGVYDPGTATVWRETVKSTLASEGYPQEPLTGAVDMRLHFRLPRPGSHYSSPEKLKARAPLAHTQKPDVDNLAKAVLDAMTDLGVMTDDCIITRLEVRKNWCSPADAGVDIALSATH